MWFKRHKLVIQVFQISSIISRAHAVCVRVLLCVSCVPASCVHIWFVSCPRLMSLWVNSCPAVFVSLSVINLCILVHACSVWFCLVYSLLPRCILSMSVMPFPTLMSPLNIIIWVYVLVCVFLFLPRVCTVTVWCLWSFMIVACQTVRYDPSKILGKSHSTLCDINCLLSER